MLGEEGGICVPYGSNHWNLEKPNIDNLIGAAIRVIESRDRFSLTARKRAEDLFDVEKMVDLYLGFMLD